MIKQDIFLGQAVPGEGRVGVHHQISVLDEGVVLIIISVLFTLFELGKAFDTDLLSKSRNRKKAI